MSYQKNLYFGSVQSVCVRHESMGKTSLVYDKMKKEEFYRNVKNPLQNFEILADG